MPIAPPMPRPSATTTKNKATNKKITESENDRKAKETIKFRKLTCPTAVSFVVVVAIADAVVGRPRKR